MDNISSDEEGTWSSQPGRSLKPTQGGAAGAGLNASTGNEVAELLDDLKHKDPLERQDALWSLIARKEVPQAHKQLTQFTTSRSSYIKRYSGLVAREGKRVMTGTTANGGRTRPIKELQVKSKKIARELIVHMKGSEKREKDIKKAAAKREQERVKQEEEMKDAKRQARKLNFLLEQTELYGHFIGSKIRSPLPSGFSFEHFPSLIDCDPLPQIRPQTTTMKRRQLKDRSPLQQLTDILWLTRPTVLNQRQQREL